MQGIINANSKLKKHLITTKIEHPSVYEVFRHYEENGFRVDYFDVDKNGFIEIRKFGSWRHDFGFCGCCK